MIILHKSAAYHIGASKRVVIVVYNGTIIEYNRVDVSRPRLVVKGISRDMVKFG